MSTLTTSYQLLDSKYLGTSGGNLYVRIYAKYSEQDITNNKTKVQYQARAYYENSTYIYDQGGNGSVSGTSASTVSGSCTRPTTGETVIATTEAWVPHNSDGTMSVTASATLNFPNWGWSATASADATLPTIPRATACPNLDGYIESSAPISLNPASTSFKHRLYYSYNGKTGYYPSSSGFFVNTGSLSLDTSFYSYTPKSSGTGSITLYTYDSNGNLIGSKTGSITVRCDADKCRPSISATIVDSNETTIALTGDNTKLIKGYSNAQITYTISAKNSATLSSKTINGRTLGTSPYTISGISTGTFSIVATDSRGFSTTLPKTNTLINYIPLTLEFIPFRPTPTGSAIAINFQGNYFNSSFGSVANELSLSWKYRVKGASSWEDGGIFVKDTDYTISGNRFESIGDIILSDTLFDYQTSYEIAVYYADKLIDTYSIKPVTKGEAVLSWEDLLVKVKGALRVTNEIIAGDVKCKNWFNIDGALAKLNSGYAYTLEFTKTKTGAKLNVISDSSAYAYGDLIIPIVGLEGKEVTLSWECEGNFELNGNVKTELYYCDIEGSSRTTITQYIGHPTTSYKFTIPEAPVNNYICIRLLIYAGYVTTGNYVEFSNIQLEEGVVTDYMPNKGVGYTSGSNDYGSWIKFENGTMITRRTLTTTIACTNSWVDGSLYYGLSATEWSFPQNFVDIPDVDVHVKPNGNYAFLQGCDNTLTISTTGVKNISIYRPNAVNNIPVKITIIAIGSWK